MIKSNSKKAEKTKNQIETTINLHIVVILGAILIFIAPLLHIDLPTTNSKVDSFKVAYQEKFDAIKVKKALIRNQYDSKIITGDQKILNDDLLKVEEDRLQADYKIKLNDIINQNRVFGWKTLKKFLIGFGVRLPYLFFTLLIVYLIKLINTEDKYLKRTFTFVTISLFTISFYQLIWVFWDKQDFPKGYYYITALFLGFTASIIAVSFLKYRVTLETKFKNIINRLIVFIIKSDKYIEEKSTKTQHLKDYLTEFEKIIK